jgi:hypothetical protein
VAIAVALWLVVPVANRARQLMREHPDLYITERWRGRRASADESESGRRLRQRMAAERARTRRNILIGAIVVIAAAAVIAFLGGRTREPATEPAEEWVPPTSIEPYTERFLEAWNRSDLEALGKLIHARDSRYLAKVRRRLRKRGWEERLPTLLPGRFDQQEDDQKLEVTFALKDYDGTVELGTVWWWADGAWWWYGSIWPKSEELGR